MEERSERNGKAAIKRVNCFGESSLFGRVFFGGGEGGGGGKDVGWDGCTRKKVK